MSWLSALSATSEPELARERAHLRLRQAAERKAQAPQLLARGGEQEIALVALGIGGAIERLPALAVVAADDIMAGGQQVGAEVGGGFEQIDEFHVLVARDARDRRLAGDIGARERLDHLLAKTLLVIEHIVRHAEPRGDVAGVVDVLAGAAGALAMRRRAVIVELHGQADDIIALARQHRGDDAGIDAARHRHDDARIRRRLWQAQGIDAGAAQRRRWDMRISQPDCTARRSGGRRSPARKGKLEQNRAAAATRACATAAMQ